MNFVITELISRVRWIAACALITGSGLTHAQAPWAKDLVNPASVADDVVLPMPCGGSMTFRRINIPSADALDDRRVQLGSPEPKFAYSENSRSDYVGGGFIDAKTKNQRYYLIGKYEVTRLQFDALSGTCPAVNPEGRLPKVGVTWNEAVFYTGHYADWLAKNGGANLPQEDGMPGFVRLPTEAEWEFAARGGVAVAETVFEQPAFPMPDGPQRYAWYSGTDSSNNELNGIGLLKPNPLGLHDMLGNAGEFVLDAFRLNKHSRLHGQAGGYVVKGGDYRTALADLRTAARSEYIPIDKNGARRDKATGLRLVVVPGSLPTPGRLQSVRTLWGNLTTSPSGASQALTDPVKEVEALAKAAADPAMKARIEGVGNVIKANIQSRNEQRDRSAKSEIRVAAYLGRKILEDGLKIKAQEAFAKVAPDDPKAKAAVETSRENLDATLNYMLETVKQIGLDYPAPTATAQGEILKREFEARSVPGYSPLIDLVVARSQASRGGKPPTKPEFLTELASLEGKVLRK